MARRTCFREEYYTGMRRYNSAREDCRQRPKKTIYINWSVYGQYLWIDHFVWARGFCGTRICCSASVGCSGTIQKIHMGKIRLRQGQRMHVIMMDFIIWGRLTRPRGPFRAQGFALTRNVARSHGSKNLLQRAILYRHKKIYDRQGRLQAI